MFKDETLVSGLDSAYVERTIIHYVVEWVHDKIDTYRDLDDAELIDYAEENPKTVSEVMCDEQV